jgi:gliding motility-associated-like protein
MKLRFLYLLFSLLILQVNSFAQNDILGGYMEMKATGTPDKYQVLLHIFISRKFATGNALALSTSSTAFQTAIYQKNGDIDMNSVRGSTFTAMNTTPFPSNASKCYDPSEMLVVEVIRTVNYTLPASSFSAPGGYYITCQRCCRPTGISNITGSGYVFYLEFPPLSTNNSSPKFSKNEGALFCANRPATLDASATDSDGDQLEYSLVTPYIGHSSSSNLSPNGVITPIAEASWTNSNNAASPLPTSGGMTINSTTGQITFTPTNTGKYSMTVMVKEKRGGVVIGQIRRDYTFDVWNCEAPEKPIIYKKGSTPQVHATTLSFCSGETLEIETKNQAGYSYQWKLGNGDLAGQTGLSSLVTTAGTYTVYVSKTTASGCIADETSDGTAITVLTVPVARFTTTLPNYCSGDINKVVNLSVLVNPAPSTGTGVFSGTGINGNNFEVKKAGVGSHKITYTYTAPNTCKSSTDQTIIVDKTPRILLGDDFTIFRGQTIDLSGIGSSGSGYTYNWTWTPNVATSGPVSGPATLVAINVQPQVTTNYTLTVTSAVSTCNIADDINITVREPLTVYTAFTPNGDNQNDVWEIDGINLYPHPDVKIMNRWGGVIFHSVDNYANQPFDGIINGERVPAGTYFYVIKASDDTPTLTGSVTIVR